MPSSRPSLRLSGCLAGGLGAVVAAGIVAPAFAADLDVPGDFATIPAAIAAAVDGDVIRIAPGTWVGGLTITNKSITLEGTGPGPNFVTIDGDADLNAIRITGGSGPVTIRNLTIRNGGVASSIGVGGGLRIEDNDAILEDLIIRDNRSNVGAGIYAVDSSVTATDCSFIGNESDAGGGIVYMFGPGEQTVLSGCQLLDNEAGSTLLFAFRGDLALSRCEIADNTGGKLLSNRPDTTLSLENSVVRDNALTFEVLEVDADSVAKVVNVTAVRNGSGPFGSVVSTGALTVTNSIVEQDGSGPPLEGSGTITVEYSNIEGGWPGAGNIAAPSLFEDPAFDLRLQPGSPGVDAGAFQGFGLDLAGNQRVVDDRNIPNTGSGTFAFTDMGAYERSLSVRYVDPNAAPGGDGYAWSTAYTHPQEALLEDGLFEVEEVWIAAGTWTADQGSGDRDASFEMRTGLAIRGGFAGGEIQRGQADGTVNVTTFSGNINTSFFDDNTRHVVRATDVGAGSILTDVNILRGYADGAVPYGGGIYSVGGKPVFERVSVSRCNALDGAGVAAFGGAPVFLNCRVFNHNTAGYGDAVVRFEDAEPTLEGVLISSNEHDEGPALLFVDCAPVTVVNTTVAGNRGTGPTAGVLFRNSTVKFFNSIVWANQTTSPGPGAPPHEVQVDRSGTDGQLIGDYVSIQDWPGGSLFFDEADAVDARDPKFVDPDGADGIPANPDDDWRLSAGSCAIDAADSDTVSIAVDLDGQVRRRNDPGTPDSGEGAGAPVDRGAYEFDGISCRGDLDGNGEVGFDDLLGVLAAWGTCDGCPADITCDGQVGFPDLVALLASFGPCPG